jgi:hypothetical protein
MLERARYQRAIALDLPSIASPPAPTDKDGSRRTTRRRQEAREDAMHHANSFFGHSTILCAYAGREDRNIPAYIQHGWGEFEAIPDAPYLPGLPKLVWNERNARDARRFGGRIEAIGAPFLYLEGGHAAPEPIVDRESTTIVYPYHSWDYDVDAALERPGVQRDATYHSGHRAFAAEIRERETGEVTVVLYWRDYEDAEARAAYADQGLRVICHGYRLDNGFLARQRQELRRHSRAVSNRLGSAIWYAGHLGLELAAYGPFTGSHPEEARVLQRLQHHRWPEMFQDKMDPDAAREHAAEELGLAAKRDPEELVELFGWQGWRGRLAKVIDFADRGHHKLRWRRHQRRLSVLPPYWEHLLDDWGVPPETPI